MPSNPTRERGQRRAFGNSMYRSVQLVFVLSGSCIVCTSSMSQITRCTLRCPRGSTALVHLTTSPPHHLTTSPRRKKHSNPPTTRFIAFCTEAFSMILTKDLARDFVSMRLARARSLAARSGVHAEARRWSRLAPAFVNFVLVTDHNSLS